MSEQAIKTLAREQPVFLTTASRPGVALFSVGEIPFRLDYSWFFLFVLLMWGIAAGYLPTVAPEANETGYWLFGLLGALLVFASILAHELAHALAARRHGVDVRAVTLFLFGGVAEMQGGPRHAESELRIAIVGPLTSLAFAMVFFAARAMLAPAPDLAGVLAGYLAGLNVALAVFNLLPGHALAAGRVPRAALWSKVGAPRRPANTAVDVGRGAAIALMLLGAAQLFTGAPAGGLWLVFVGLFLRSAALGYQRLLGKHALGDAVVEQVMRRDPVTVSPMLPLRRLVEDYALTYGIRSFPVAVDGSVLGLVSIDDVTAVPRERWDETRVDERMRPLGPANTIAPDTPVDEALAKLAKANDGPDTLVVMQGSRLVGVLGRDGMSRFVEIQRGLETG